MYSVLVHIQKILHIVYRIMRHLHEFLICLRHSESSGQEQRIEPYTLVEKHRVQDYFIGMEWWVYRDSEGEEYWLIGVVYIENHDGVGNFGYSCHLRVPDAVVEGLFDWQGRDLEQVVHALGGEESIGDKNGSYHAWTDGMLSRKEQFIMATQCAITPFFNIFYIK